MTTCIIKSLENNEKSCEYSAIQYVAKSIATCKKNPYILPWHLLGHVIMSVICFDLQFSRSTRSNNVILYIHSVHKHRGNAFQRQNYKMRLKQRSLNWINSMQVKKILFTNVFFSWSLCLLNMFLSMVFPKHFYFSGLLT